MAVELDFLGPPRVRRAAAVVRFDTRKAVALLCLLAVTGEDHGRDAIASLLWPDLERARARATLRRTLSVAAAVGPALAVRGDRVGLDLDIEPVDCDVVRFRRLAASSEVEDWRSAALLPADRFLDGFSLRDSPAFDDWAIGVAAELTDALSDVLARLTRDAGANGDWEEGRDWARRRVQIDPLSEPAHADLIRATAFAGDRHAAVQAYRSLVRLLDTELGVAPLPETMALHDDIRAGRLQAPREREAVTPAARAPRERVRLVGREAELAALEAAWRDAAEGRPGRVLGLVGEPGLGKTVLLDVATRRAGARILRVGGRASETSLAYAAANDFVRAMLSIEPALATQPRSSVSALGALASEIASPHARGIRTAGDLQRVHDAVRAALSRIADAGPVLLVVDDAELIDRPSALLLAYAVRRLPPGVLTLVAWRPGTTGGPLQHAVSETGEARRLLPLDADQIADLVGEALDPAEVLRRTRGIPLLVTEQAGSPAGVAGTDVRDIVAARFAGASDTARQVVTSAVVIGTVAPPELLRAVSGRDESETVDAIEEAVARGLLVEHAETAGYDVPHDLVRDAAQEALSLARRRLLHGRLADVLIRRHGVDPSLTPAGAVARHLASAGREDEAADWFLAAASDSSRLGAHEEAIGQLRSALALGRRDSDVHASIGTALVRLGRYDEALVALDQASAAAESDAGRRAEIDHAIARVHDRRGDLQLALSHLESALESSGPEGRGRRARMVADLALVLHRLGRRDEARATASTARVAGMEEGDAAAVIQAGNVLGMIALAEGEQDDAEAHLEDAVARADAYADDDLLIATLNNLSRARAQRGAADEALDAARQALRCADRQGDRHRQGALHSHLADLLHAAGRDEEAMAELRASAIAFSEVQGSAARPEVWTLTEW
ncbi:AAA family ATPase [Microbacterium sp. ABRD28]|uniref:ATP-binding protein n=1 Tax=Microbacterium sp. ABRD28 TaxID=2268461 RepID=UPI000F554309|nr:AAA family ATPase [Microbacterium sp. ABRD28]AZC14441.1 hypothetical protein DT073_12655 [Microbacterium sp. ABRD28]